MELLTILRKKIVKEESFNAFFKTTPLEILKHFTLRYENEQKTEVKSTAIIIDDNSRIRIFCIRNCFCNIDLLRNQYRYTRNL